MGQTPPTQDSSLWTLYFIIRTCFATAGLTACHGVALVCIHTEDMQYDPFFPALTPSPAYLGGCISWWSFTAARSVQVLEVVWHLLQMLCQSEWEHTGWAINSGEVSVMFFHTDVLHGLWLGFSFFFFVPHPYRKVHSVLLLLSLCFCRYKMHVCTYFIMSFTQTHTHSFIRSLTLIYACLNIHARRLEVTVF